MFSYLLLLWRLIYKKDLDTKMRISDVFGTYTETNRSSMNSQSILSESSFDQFYWEVRRVLKPGRTLNLPLEPSLAGDLNFLLQLVDQIPGLTPALRESAETAMSRLKQLINAELAQNVFEFERLEPDLKRQKSAQAEVVSRAQEELERAQEELERLETLLESNYGQLKHIDEFQQRMGLKTATKSESLPDGRFPPAIGELQSPFQQLPMPPASGDRSDFNGKF